MADKFLTESHWKTTTKGKDITGDAEVLKALGLLARAEKGKPGAATLASLREALGAIDKAMAAFEKANAKVVKADKTLIALLADIGKATERARKDLVMAQAKAEADAEADEDDAPDILTTRMVPLLRQVRQGAEMHTKLALAGRELVVMLSRKAIPPTRKALLAEMLEQKSSIKVVDGTCVLENKFVTFVLNNPAAGLAKRISAALMKQTGLRVPVRVRGPDGDLDEDDDADGTDATPDDKTKATTQPPPEAAKLSDRLKALMPDLQKALAGKHPASDALKRGASEAGALLKQSRWDAAAKLIQLLETQLKTATASPTAEQNTPAQPEGGSAKPQAGRFVNHARSRIAWQKVRQKVQADLGMLEKAILAYCKTQPDLNTDAASKVRKLDAILTTLDESLSDTLDQALNAPDDRQRLALHEQSRKVLARYIQFVSSDPLLEGVDQNPFVPLKTREFLTSSLQALDKSLA